VVLIVAVEITDHATASLTDCLVAHNPDPTVPLRRKHSNPIVLLAPGPETVEARVLRAVIDGHKFPARIVLPDNGDNGAVESLQTIEDRHDDAD